MLRSICVSVRYFPLMALMACYLSKPVFKCPIMAFHMRHPVTLGAALFLSQLNNVEVFLKVIFGPSSACHIWECLTADGRSPAPNVLRDICSRTN